MELNEYFEQAELALAAYADLPQGINVIAALKDADMSETQAIALPQNIQLLINTPTL